MKSCTESDNINANLFYLDGGGEEPGTSRGFFWPIEGFFGGALLLIPAGEVPEGIRWPNWHKQKSRNTLILNKVKGYSYQVKHMIFKTNICMQHK